MKMEKLFAQRDSITIIVGGGPSLNECPVRLGLSYPNVHYLAINDAYRLLPEASLFYACDYRWWEYHYESLQRLPGMKVTIDAEAARRWPDLQAYHGVDGIGLCKIPHVLHTGKNSGYQAINLAYHGGARRIILLGYDLQKSKQRSHWFMDNPFTQKANYKNWIPRFEPLAKDLMELGIDVINCSPNTALTAFPVGDFAETLQRWLPRNRS